MHCINFKAAIVVFLAMAIAAHADTTACDGNQSSVANCCEGDLGNTCNCCRMTYGLSKDKTQCVKCKASNCADCPGNPSVCKTLIKPPIPNCDVPYDAANSQCLSCDDGYTLTANKQACIKCPANCADLGCNASKPNACFSCQSGYGVTKTKTCSKCKSKDPNCQNCGSDLVACVKCAPGYTLKNGKCQSCGPNVYSCDNGKIVCYADGGVGTFGANGGCKKCPSLCQHCDKSACDQCYAGFTYVGGKCILPAN